MSAARRGVALALALAVAVGPIAGCSDDDGPAEGEATLEVDGRAVIVRQGGEEDTVSDDEVDVRVGDAITLTEGTGRLDLGDGAQLELRAGSGEDPDSELVMGPVPVLESGDVLATTDEEIALTVDGTRVRVVAGSARASRTSGLEVAAYDADVDLDSAGQERAVPALREMQVPALGHPPEAARPLEYDASDPWDRRFLGEAIDLGQRLQALSDGYTQNLPDTTPRTPGFFKDVLPGLVDDVDFTAALLDGQRARGGDPHRRRHRRPRPAGHLPRALGLRVRVPRRRRGVGPGGARPGRGRQPAARRRHPSRRLHRAGHRHRPHGRGPHHHARPAGPRATTVPRGSTTPTTPPGGSPATTVPTPGDPGDDDGGLLGPVVSPVTDLLAGLINGLLGGLFTSG